VKILLAHNYYQSPGGEDQVFKQECRLLESYGHEVVTYERNNNELLANSPTQRLFLPMRVVWSQDSYLQVLELLQREKPQIVHVHNYLLRSLPRFSMPAGKWVSRSFIRFTIIGCCVREQRSSETAKSVRNARTSAFGEVSGTPVIGNRRRRPLPSP
jgi:hypothetical protein